MSLGAALCLILLVGWLQTSMIHQVHVQLVLGPAALLNLSF